MEQVLLFILMAVVMYFLMIKPQQKRVKEAQDMLASLRKGVQVVTIGGLHGVIEEVSDTTVVLDCEGVYLTFERRAIARVVTPAVVTESVVNETETELEA